ncbi:MAG: hypothetical protein DIZ77_03905 [endosymbiont of Seepiophila jonesi]|uniref:Uncharacterized protein n=1 Tax=endosymbiont of Lamellibrachia luymesi TaxID=2200907 RepID=A0A370DYE5_9GAMM|nr:MAG: hypothetical protein DIZ79_06565 [endosymbiont of Lamellibrachia luymesi]RDH93949.1 MAG: hypothetical protein DIZ77_03905 [endosymbiont of Seepiophila jonesi]
MAIVCLNIWTHRVARLGIVIPIAIIITGKANAVVMDIMMSRYRLLFFQLRGVVRQSQYIKINIGNMELPHRMYAQVGHLRM